MKLILLTISVVSLLSACTTGEQMSRLEPGMTRQQVVGILGRPNAVRSYGPYEQLEYTHRLITGWSWDRSDFKVILKDGREQTMGHWRLEDVWKMDEEFLITAPRYDNYDHDIVAQEDAVRRIVVLSKDL